LPGTQSDPFGLFGIAKLTLIVEDGAQHRRVAAVLTFLRNQDLRGSPEARTLT
jgi:hypothetical protein